MDAGNRPGRVLLAVFSVWLLVVSGNDLKRFAGLLHWGLLALLFAVALPGMVRMRWRPHLPLLAAASGVVLAILLSGSADPAYALVQSLKLAAILLLLLQYVLNQPELARRGIRLLVLACFVNAAMLATMLVQPGPFASIMAPGRWGTVMNWPGSLWRAGMCVLVYGSVLACTAARPWRGLAVVATASVVVYADGSRTGMLLLPFAAAFTLFALGREALRHRVLFRLTAFSLSSAAAAGAFLWLRDWWFGTRGGVQDALARITPLFEAASDSARSFAESDPWRYNMIQSVAERIRESPFLGSGLGTSRASEGSGQVVHMTYLQLWGDLGVLGAIAFTVLAGWWLTHLPRFHARLRALADPEDRALYANAVFVLFAFAFSATLHPISTEQTEWIPFALAASVARHIGERTAVSAAAVAIPSPAVCADP